LQHLTLVEGVMVAGVRIPDGVRRRVLLRLLAGVPGRGVAREFAMSGKSVSRIRHDPAVRAQLYQCRRSMPKARLTLDEREEISRGLSVRESMRSIARRLQREPSTITREIELGGGPDRYRAASAHEAAQERARRPKSTVFERCPRLAAQVEAWLEHEQWSPAQISGTLVDDFPDDAEMRVAPETIYQALYVFGRGGLRKELAKHLRSQRTQRRSRVVTTRNRSTNSIPDLVSIAERPDDVEARLVPGHWEGDLIMGRNNTSQVLTLVERVSGYVLLGKLDSKHADGVAAKLQQLIEALPAELARTITWDRGTEMADHTTFTVATGVKVYFCDPHAPWQRGSNENINGLLRQYLPRDTDLSTFSQDELDAIAAKLNRRPRKRHNWKTPTIVLDQFVLH
jgi:transposase, IS30 family